MLCCASSQFIMIPKHFARDNIVYRRTTFKNTWLILPVVICLSQILSHACLSISVYTAKLRMVHSNSYSLFLMVIVYMDNSNSLRPNTCAHARLRGQVVFISYRTNPGLPGLVVIHNNRTNHMAAAGDESFKFLTYQLPTVGYCPTVAMTGNGKVRFDSGEGA